jgi:hypothetical protein
MNYIFIFNKIDDYLIPKILTGQVINLTPPGIRAGNPGRPKGSAL